MKNQGNDVHEIALIGYSQAGKTTLAVGLFATSTESFSVTGKGEETTTYLRERKAALESGQWLDATTEQQMPDIRLVISRLGKAPVEVDFKEYMGERARNSDSYKRDVIGDPRAAMILLNPGMEILRDPVRRNEMIGQIKDIVEYLSEPGRCCSHIAFVVTAADLLTTTLRDYKDEFDGYKAEIVNCLNTNPKFQKSWKEFAVTVTGPLDDPMRPRIAQKGGNTSREPFEWLVDQIEASARSCSLKRLVRRLSVTAATLLALAGVAFSGWYFHFDRAAERRVRGIESRHGALLEKAVKDGKAADINKLCNDMEKELPGVSSKSAFFAGNRVRHSKAVHALERKIESGRLSWYPLEMTRKEKDLTDFVLETGLTVEEFGEKKDGLLDFDRKIRSFAVKTEDLKPRLPGVQKKWADARARIEKALDDGCCTGLKRQFDQRSQSAETTATEENCVSWKHEWELWRPLTEAGKNFQKELLARFDQNRRAWRVRYENRQFEDGASVLLGKIGAAVGDLNNGDAINEALVGCKKYEALAQAEESRSLVDWQTRKAVWSKVKAERERLLDELLKSQVARVKPREAIPPQTSADDLRFIEAVLKGAQALSEEEYGVWTNRLATKVGEMREEWLSWQKEECAKFVDRIKGSKAAVETLRDYQSFCSDFPNAPDLESVAVAVNNVVVAALNEILDETASYSDSRASLFDATAMAQRNKKMNATYNKLKILVNATIRTGENGNCSGFDASPAYNYAVQCQAKGNVKNGGVAEAFVQKYEITRIDAMIEYREFQTFFKHVAFAASRVELDGRKTLSFLLTPIGSCKDLGKDANGTWQTIWTGCAVVEGTPWLDALFSLKVTDVNSLIVTSDQTTEWRWRFHSGENYKTTNGCVEQTLELETGRLTGDSKPNIHVRIYVKGSGYDFFDFYKNGGQP